MNAFLEAEAIDLFRIVHGEQKFAYERPIVAGDVLTATLTVASLRQIAGNDIIGTTSEVTDASGALVCSTSATLVHRGADAMTLETRSSPSPAPTWCGTPPRAVTTTRSTRTRTWRGASGCPA